MDSNKKVLIVDDDKFTAMMLRRMIKESVGEIDHVNSGEEAIKKLNEDHYELVFLDLNLPGKSGIDVLNEVRDCTTGTHFIGMSSERKHGAKMLFERAGLHHLLNKPFSSNQLPQQFL